VKGLFYPESIMVVGVSETRTNLGRYIVENLDRFQFKGRVYLVGREGGSLNGRKIYAHIEEIDASVDLAVFLIPAPFIPEAMEVCGKKGIRYAVIESGGFSELADENSITRWSMSPKGGICVSWGRTVSASSTLKTAWSFPLFSWIQG
jgi:acyl-CoA synthetase (NDP forming)